MKKPELKKLIKKELLKEISTSTAAAGYFLGNKTQQAGGRYIAGGFEPNDSIMKSIKKQEEDEIVKERYKDEFTPKLSTNMVLGDLGITYDFREIISKEFLDIFKSDDKMKEIKLWNLDNYTVKHTNEFKEMYKNKTNEMKYIKENNMKKNELRKIIREAIKEEKLRMVIRDIVKEMSTSVSMGGAPNIKIAKDAISTAESEYDTKNDIYNAAVDAEESTRSDEPQKYISGQQNKDGKGGKGGKDNVLNSDWTKWNKNQVVKTAEKTTAEAEKNQAYDEYLKKIDIKNKKIDKAKSKIQTTSSKSGKSSAKKKD